MVKALGPAFKSSALTQYAGLSLFLVLSLSPRGFSPGTPIYPLRRVSKALLNRPFAAGHSRGTEQPSWRANVALGQDK